MRITANQVTLMRLVAMPLPCWLLYQGHAARVWALIVATLIGCTDFIDGYLARKQGPTVLGGLMDPIADKVFVAVCYLPALDLGWVPLWLVALLFVREFFVTALRTCFETRSLPHRSPYIARYKTWVQMCGIGLILLFSTVSETTVNWVLGLAAVLALGAFVGRYLWSRALWFSGAAFALSFTGFWLIHSLAGSRVTAQVLLYFVVAITWLSASDYLLGLRRLVRDDPFVASEWIRLVSSLLFPLVALIVQVNTQAPKWPVIALVALEMAYGGLDIFFAHQRAQESGLRWGLRVGLEMSLLLVALRSVSAFGWVLAALVVGIVTTTWAFVQGAAYYRSLPALASR